MFVIMCYDAPRAIVETLAEAQELVADLSWEFAYFHFNWIMQSGRCTPKVAMGRTEFCQYWYKEVPNL